MVSTTEEGMGFLAALPQNDENYQYLGPAICFVPTDEASATRYLVDIATI